MHATKVSGPTHTGNAPIFVTPVNPKEVKDLLNSTPSGGMGLCTTCNNIPECGYRETRGFDAIFCELFDTYTPPRARAADSDHESSRNAPKDRKGNRLSNNPHSNPGSNNPEDNVKGLCINCDHRNDCCLPKPEGGIWHCEEYE